MKRWKSILSVLVVLWLPVQGYAAVAMPFCQHGMAGSAAHDRDAGRVDHSRHRHDGHAGHLSHADGDRHAAGGLHATHAGGHDAGGPGCNNCGACHLACAPAIPATAPMQWSSGNPVLESAAAGTPPFFYPEPLQRPPLSALV